MFAPYTVLVFPLLLIAYWCLSKIKSNEKQAKILVFLLFAFTILSWIAFNSTINTQLDFDFDRDEALEIAATRFLNWQYPYSEKTQVGNPITPMMGAVLLAIPFVLLGNVASQNFFWLGVLLLFVRQKSLSLACLLLSPMILQEYFFESDLLTNSIYVSVAILLYTKNQNIITAIFLGVVLSSRMNMLVWFLILFLHFRDYKKMIAPTLVFLALTLPFFLYSPLEFRPLHVFGKMKSAIPYSGAIIILLTLTFIFIFRNLHPLMLGSLSLLIPTVLASLIYVNQPDVNERLAYTMFAVPPMLLYLFRVFENDHKTHLL